MNYTDDDFQKLFKKIYNLEQQINILENNLKNVKKIYNILFPLIIGMIIGIYFLVF